MQTCGPRSVSDFQPSPPRLLETPSCAIWGAQFGAYCAPASHKTAARSSLCAALAKRAGPKPNPKRPTNVNSPAKRLPHTLGWPTIACLQRPSCLQTRAGCERGLRCCSFERKCWNNWRLVFISRQEASCERLPLLARSLLGAGASRPARLSFRPGFVSCMVARRWTFCQGGWLGGELHHRRGAQCKHCRLGVAGPKLRGSCECAGPIWRPLRPLHCAH